LEEEAHGTIWEGCCEKRGERGASGEERDIALWKRRKGRAGDEPEAGDRDWVVGSAQERRKSSREEIRIHSEHVRGSEVWCPALKRFDMTRLFTGALKRSFPLMNEGAPTD
jgi:hypothetical protein